MSSKERGRKGIFEMVKQGCLKLGKIRLPRFMFEINENLVMKLGSLLWAMSYQKMPQKKNYWI